MTNDARQMIGHGPKRKGSVLERVGEPLDRAVKSRGRRIDEEKMVEPFGNKAPASNQWIAQNQGGIVPDKTVSQRWSIADKDSGDDEQDGETLFHKKRIGQNQ